MPGRLRLQARRMEGNPETQYRFHRFMARFWIGNAVVLPVAYFLLPAKVLLLYLAMISVYANWATDHGSMSAADAATSDVITEHARAAADCAGTVSPGADNGR
jgi:hypothetical protein